MKAAALLLVLALCVVIRGDETLLTETYNGWKVVRVNLEHEKQLEIINQWGLDVWSRDSVLTLGENDIRVNQTHLELLPQLKVNYEFLIEDLKTLMDEHRDSIENRVDAANWFAAWHTWDEIVAHLTNLTSHYSSLAKWVPSIGTTVQGRAIPAIVITGNNGNNNKKKIFFSAQQHAREWIASHNMIYILESLLSTYSTNTQVKNILDNVVFHIVPLVNPDGYIYSWTTERLWRKNRRANSGGSYGVDLNRNWNDHWGGEGSSGTPTSDTYRGTKAFSEPESTAVSNYVLANGPFNAGIDWHSYSQLILRPYGWTKTAPANEKVAKTVGDTMRDRIYAVNKVTYTSEASWELYFTTGSAQDWYFSEGKMPLSYTIELRDTGRYGFVLPASEIIPTGNENLAAVKYFSDYVIAN